MARTSRLVAEGVGTAFLLIAVIGSGIMGERLSAGNLAVALLANSLATGAALACLIVTIGPISGAHLNPLVSVTASRTGALSGQDAAGYVAAQLVGGIAGVAVTHVMFDLPWYSLSQHARTGAGQWTGEVVATFGLLSVVAGASRTRPPVVPFVVGGYIMAAYWFTSSTSFANPAVTIARAFSDTFAGIRPADVPGFIAGQALGAIVAGVVWRGGRV